LGAAVSGVTIIPLKVGRILWGKKLADFATAGNSVPDTEDGRKYTHKVMPTQLRNKLTIKGA
jgi:hypothetical protein